MSKREKINKHHQITKRSVYMAFFYNLICQGRTFTQCLYEFVSERAHKIAGVKMTPRGRSTFKI